MLRPPVAKAPARHGRAVPPAGSEGALWETSKFGGAADGWVFTTGDGVTGYYREDARAEGPARGTLWLEYLVEPPHAEPVWACLLEGDFKKYDFLIRFLFLA